METPDDLERAKLVTEGFPPASDRNVIGDVTEGSRWKSRFHNGMATVVGVEGEHVVYENDGVDTGRYRQRLTTLPGAPGFLFAWRRVDG